MTWATVPIGTVIRSSQYGLSLPADPDGLLPIVGMKDIQDGRVGIDPTVCVNMSEDDAQNYLLADGDILLNRTNSPDLVGKTGIYRGDGKAVFASYLVRLVLDRERVDPDYVIQILASEGGQRRIKQLATRAVSQANLNPTTFKNHFYIPLPQLGEQIAIRRVLLAWDTAIEKTERLIAAKEKRKSGLMSKLLTGKQRLNGFNASWRNAYLGELFRERVEVNWNDLQLLSITGENGVVLRSDLNRKDSSNDDKSKYLRICPGDIGYNTMRMWQGVSALSSHEGIISPAYTVCIPSPEIDGRFASYLFKLPEVIHLFYRYSQGLTSDTWNLKFHHFAEVQVYIPWVDEQIAIASVLATIDEELVILKNQRNALAKQKRGLMQKLLTGQWRVKTAELETQ